MVALSINAVAFFALHLTTQLFFADCTLLDGSNRVIIGISDTLKFEIGWKTGNETDGLALIKK